MWKEKKNIRATIKKKVEMWYFKDIGTLKSALGGNLWFWLFTESQALKANRGQRCSEHRAAVSHFNWRAALSWCHSKMCQSLTETREIIDHRGLLLPTSWWDSWGVLGYSGRNSWTQPAVKLSQEDLGKVAELFFFRRKNAGSHTREEPQPCTAPGAAADRWNDPLLPSGKDPWNNQHLGFIGSIRAVVISMFQFLNRNQANIATTGTKYIFILTESKIFSLPRISQCLPSLKVSVGGEDGACVLQKRKPKAQWQFAPVTPQWHSKDTNGDWALQSPVWCHQTHPGGSRCSAEVPVVLLNPLEMWKAAPTMQPGLQHGSSLLQECWGMPKLEEDSQNWLHNQLCHLHSCYYAFCRDIWIPN